MAMPSRNSPRSFVFCVMSKYLECFILSLIVPNKKENYFHQLANSSPLVSLVLKGILYIILGILLVIFGYQEGFETLEWVACIVITIVLIAVGLCQLIAAIIKNKTK